MQNDRQNNIEALHLLGDCRKLIPGFTKAIAFVYQPVEKTISAFISTVESENIEEIDSNSHPIDDEIFRLRTKKTSEYDWVDESKIPFKVTTRTDIRKDLFNELENLIFLFKVRSLYDAFYDLVYIYFKEDASNFGIRTSDSVLNTEQKSIIGKLLNNSLNVISANFHISNDNINLLRKDIRNLEQHLEKETLKIQKIKSEQQQQISNYILHLFTEKASEQNLFLKLSAEAQNYINEYVGEISLIPNSVKNCFEMAMRIQNPLKGTLISIELYMIQINFNTAIRTPINVGIEHLVENKYQSTAQLLNKLEQSAKKVQIEGKALTSANIGSSMERPITAPAISDAIKKRKSKIEYLLKENPNEWQLIRTHFKPIINSLRA